MTVELIEALCDLLNRYWFPLVALVLLILWLKPYIDAMLLNAIHNSEKDKLKKIQENWEAWVKLANRINKILYQLLYTYWACRVYVFQYHNWWKSISWIDFQRASNTYEVVSNWIKPEISLKQNLPIGVFAYWNLRIVQNKCIHYSDIERLKEEDLATYQSVKSQWIKSIYVIWLYDDNNLPIWFVWMEFCDTKVKLTDKQIGEFKQESMKLWWLLY